LKYTGEGGAVSKYKAFFVEALRLVLMIASVLAGLTVILWLPMVDALPRVPMLGVPADLLITALAYVAILALVVNFARKIEAVSKEMSLSFPWMSLVAYLAVLAGIIVAYGALTGFAAALLGRHYWIYPFSLLLFACVPIFQIGSLIYSSISRRLEEWKQ
jgi:hypothetical protein